MREKLRQALRTNDDPKVARVLAATLFQTGPRTGPGDVVRLDDVRRARLAAPTT